MRTIKKVYICSPYRANKNNTVSDNIARALYACRVALEEGCAPIAPHLIYPQCLDDNDPEYRKIGIMAGLSWLAACDEVWQWGTKISEGMARELDTARALKIPIRVFSSIGVPQEREEERCNMTAKSFYLSAITAGA